MIDLHTHILPNIDDGASDVETALQMTEALFSQNTMKAICTPHFDPSYSSMKDFVQNREIALRKMSESRIQLIPASETLLHDYLFHYSDLSELCIENTRYLLLELPHLRKYDQKFFKSINKLIDFYNVIPIIAHIERYQAIKHKQIRILLQMGCILQLNAESILNKQTRKKALQFIKKQYVKVVGSDCHDMKRRPPNIGKAFELIEKELGASYHAKLEYHSECIVNGIELLKKKSYIIE